MREKIFIVEKSALRIVPRVGNHANATPAQHKNMNTENNTALKTLRNHVTGAIARGEAKAIVEKTIPLTRGQLLSLISRFINQRPGFDFANYGSAASYRADYNRALRDKHDAESLLSEISWRDSITAEKIEAELTRGGRLELLPSGELHYTAGQYFPTEYRAAACRVLATILWNYFRDDCNAASPREYARKHLRNRGVARRWFN